VRNNEAEFAPYSHNKLISRYGNRDGDFIFCSAGMALSQFGFVIHRCCIENIRGFIPFEDRTCFGDVCVEIC
jgi:hypothetical protein